MYKRQFIDFNTEKRRAVANNFKKDFFKLIINADYGKSLENFSKRTEFCLVSNEREMIMLSASSRFVHADVCNEDLVGVMMKKRTVYLKPSAVRGMHRVGH